ncbi:MAG: site-2 protease family protein [Myxococcota bacterium]
MSSLRFRLFGFAVEITPWFLVLLGLLAAFNIEAGPARVLGWTLATFVCVMVHELGHAAVARQFGLRVGVIQLHGMGGQVSHDRTTPGKQLAISLAGPGAGFLPVIPALGLAALPLPWVVADALIEPMLWIPIVYGVFNLLPIFPMDGGMALMSALKLAIAPALAEKIVGGIGLVGGALLVAWAFSNGQILLAYVAATLTWRNAEILRAHGLF